jgi:hypothetical protein
MEEGCEAERRNVASVKEVEWLWVWWRGFEREVGESSDWCEIGRDRARR